VIVLRAESLALLARTPRAKQPATAYWIDAPLVRFRFRYDRYKAHPALRGQLLDAGFIFFPRSDFDAPPAGVTGGLQHLPDLVVIQVLECNGDVGRDVDVPSNLGVDSLVVGFYRGKDLFYAARVRAGLVPATRREVYERLKHLKTPKCPFVNLPEPAAGRWGQGLTAEKMKECVWVRPEQVASIQFLEWTGADHLRHTKFVALRDDKDPSKVIRET
jgi:hypothetical protein